MGETESFPDALRAEYDAALLDVGQRTRRAQRLHTAFEAAGWWPSAARVLDVGCGSGFLLAALGHDVQQRIGCDLRPGMYVQARPQIPGVLFVQASGTQLPFPDQSFDVVICLAVIGEVEDWHTALQEMARCVAPRGVLYVTVTNGRLLVPFYTVVAKLGRRVPASWWAYARGSMRLAAGQPARGFDLPGLAGWEYLHLTPYVARSQWPWLRLLPMSLLKRFMRYVAPSLGYAWRRPGSVQGKR